MPTREPNAIITRRTDHAPGLMTIRVAPDGWALPPFVAGQYTVLGMPGSSARCGDSDPEPPRDNPEKTIMRAYSIASSSLANQHLDFYIKLVRSGELTPRLFNLQIGDRVWLSSKFTGYFTLDEVPAEKDVVLVATGTGLAPYLSMIRTHLTQQPSRRIAAIHGAYHSWDLSYQQELVMLASMSPAFTYIAVISDPDDEPVAWGGRTGFVQDVWNSDEIAQAWGGRPTPGSADVFLCGHPLMIEAMEVILQGEGFAEHTRRSAGQYHLERYW